jgi:hypothetical protein
MGYSLSPPIIGVGRLVGIIGLEAFGLREGTELYS